MGMQLSEEVKARCHADIEASNISGLYETLRIIIGEQGNPNVIPVELTLSQIEYMEKWSKLLNGTGMDTLIRMMIDKMREINPL